MQTVPQDDGAAQDNGTAAPPANGYPLADARDPFRGHRVRVIVAYEGGGAKAAVHIGALRALERVAWSATTAAPTEEPYVRWPRYDVVGVSGTSAGALIAALHAAGYSSEELRFGPNGEPPAVLTNAGLRNALEVFGRRGWRRIRLVRAVIDHSLEAAVRYLLIWALLFIASYEVLKKDALGLNLGFQSTSAWWIVAGTLGYGIAFSLRALKGIATQERIADAIDQALAVKVHDAPSTVRHGKIRRRLMALLQWLGWRRYRRRVTFSDLKLPLAVVATDLRNQRVHLFSKNTTPGYLVAEAVAASLALPVVFQPATTSSTGNLVFYDGGFISNIPSWPFDAERTIDSDLHTLSIQIANPKTEHGQSGRLSRWNVYLALLSAAIFGGQEIEKRFTRDVTVATAPDIKLLRLDMARAEFEKAVDEGEGAFEWTMTGRAARRIIMDETCRPE